MLVRIGCLLVEMGGHAACSATAVFATGILMMATPVGRQIAFHADGAVFMVVMGDDRYYQHKHADKEEEVCNVPFRFHPFVFGRGAKIEVNHLIAKHKMLKSLE